MICVCINISNPKVVLDHMILSIHNAVDYLLEKKLITTESIINGDLKIYDASRKNRNTRVIRKNDMSYLLKQPNIGERHSSISIQREADLYTLIKKEDTLYSTRKIVPHIIEFDSSKEILIMEYIQNALSFKDYSYNLPSGDFPTMPTHLLGNTIATYHKDFKNIDKSGTAGVSFLPETLPLNITIIRPGPDLFSSLSPANLKLLTIIQQHEEILNFFENVYEEWHMHKTLIHGDMKWDNILVVNEISTENVVEIRIVDWEFAAIGDPAWDIGGVLHDFISFWLDSLPITGNEDAEKLVAMTEYPLDNLKKSIRSFWRAYIETSEISPRESSRLLIRSTKYCALRVIQKAYELHQASSELTNKGIYMIQTGLNIVLDIYDAIPNLFGIPVPVGDN